MNDIIKEYVEERLYEIEDTTGLSFMLCCQSFTGVLHACLSRNVGEETCVDDREIESVVGKYFQIDSYHEGDIYFNLLDDGWDKLERKMKIQSILAD